MPNGVSINVVKLDNELLQSGLTTEQVQEFHRKHPDKWNVLSPPERDPWWKLFLSKFDDPVIRILLIAAAVALIVGAVDGEFVEGIGIIVAVLLATTLAFINEYRANRAFEVLNQVNDDLPIKVIRDGKFKTVPRRDLIPGDAVLIELGEAVPADGELLEAVSLEIDESRLTGESVPVAKAIEVDMANVAVTEGAYPPNCVLRGTTVTDGRGVIRVTAIGDETEIGKTARAATETTDEVTPLNQQLDRLSKLIGVVGFTFAALTYTALLTRGIVSNSIIDPETGATLTDQQNVFLGLVSLSVLLAIGRVWLPIVGDAYEIRHRTPPSWLARLIDVRWYVPIIVGAVVFAIGAALGSATGAIPASPSEWLPEVAAEMMLRYFMVAVTIIVVAVPEGLAMSVTLSLAYSMRRMTAANNLVRRMHATETIGAATVIASDKTGTLTENKMQVKTAIFPMNADGDNNLLVAEAIAANSTANLGYDNGQFTFLGNPTEGALLLWMKEQRERGEDYPDYLEFRKDFRIKRQLTFSTERKYMATLGASPITQTNVLHIKGAPEIILERCNRIQTDIDKSEALDDAKRQAILDEIRTYQMRGMRALGFAYTPVAADESDIETIVNQQGLAWLGFVAIEDPIRKEVPDAIRTVTKDAGVSVKIITGDSSETALDIARQIGFWNNGSGKGEIGEGEHLTGNEFQTLIQNNPDARQIAAKVRVMSRARPADKMRLVQLLQENGEVVAVTGDGTNDAPALNYANVGLSMGKTGTSIAKEASDIVLLDDSFGSIVSAIKWGRSLYQNIQRFILFQLTINVTALLIAFLGPFIGVELPLTVTQMLWVNLIMDTFAALALATEPPNEVVMKSKPRDPNAFIITPHMMRSILTVGLTFVAILLGLLIYFERGADGIVTTEELSFFFSVFIMLQLWNLFNAKQLGLNTSVFSNLRENRAFLIIAVLIFIGQIVFVTFGGEVFRTVPLSWQEWLLIIVATSPVLIVGEIKRWLNRRKGVSPTV